MSQFQAKGSWPNVLRDENLKIAASGQVWVADITCNAVPNAFAYLARIPDAFLSKGWIHHSGRGSQHRCEQHVKLGQGNDGRVSCSGKASPQDNAFMETFFKPSRPKQFGSKTPPSSITPTNRSASSLDTTIPNGCTRPWATAAPSNSSHR